MQARQGRRGGPNGEGWAPQGREAQPCLYPVHSGQGLALRPCVVVSRYASYSPLLEHKKVAGLRICKYGNAHGRSPRGRHILGGWVVVVLSSV